MAFLHHLYKVLWIYSYLVVGLIAGTALIPGFLLVRYAWTRDVVFGVSLRGDETAWTGELLRAFLVCVSLAYAWFLFGLTLVLIMALVRPLLGRSKEGDLPIPSWGLWQFYNYDGLLLFFSLVFAPFLRATGFYPVYLRLMGAKVGRNVIMNTHKVYDLDLLEIGDNTLVGADVTIIAHTAERRSIHRRRVRIGRNVTIGQGSSIFPGAVIEDHVTVGAHALVPKNAHLPAGTVWGGVPARLLRAARGPNEEPDRPAQREAS